MEVFLVLINEEAFKATIFEAVTEALGKQNKPKYHGFADIKSFIEISGISKWDLEHKFIPHPEFRKHVYKIDGQKRYIDIEPALEAARRIFKERNG